MSALVFEDLEEGDIVEYKLPSANEEPVALSESVLKARVLESDGKRLGVGYVYNRSILPLCKWSADSDDFLYDEDAEPVALSQAERALDMNRVWYSNRLVGGGMGPGNPHGEESEDCWSGLQLSEETRVVVRPEREVWW